MTPAARAKAPVETAAIQAPDAEELAIARSVMYASLFDYPLTLAQLRQTLIESAQTPTEILAVYEHSVALQAAIEHRDGFFFPAGRSDLIAERRRREGRSRRFLARHRPLLRLIALVPYVRLVALSGSVAHMNLDGAGDLDLFVVTRGRHVWSVTVAIVVLAKLMGQRRTLCANFVVADTALKFEQQDLFTASQIIHLKPLVGERVFARLLAENPFVARFYPNFHAAAKNALSFRRLWMFDPVRRAVEMALAIPAAAAEVACRHLYGTYLRRRAATWQSPQGVRLEADCLKLHTQSHRDSVLSRFDSAVSNLLRS
jgi:hypothetical protein